MALWQQWLRGTCLRSEYTGFATRLEPYCIYNARANRPQHVPRRGSHRQVGCQKEDGDPFCAMHPLNQNQTGNPGWSPS